MSLGWLTESSLIPKEPKPIKGVGTASLLSLQAAVYEREQRGSVPSAKRRRTIAESAQNAGVEARNARDAKETSRENPGSDLVTARLQQKARRYDAMQAGYAIGGGGEGPLVDFGRKRAEAGASGYFPPAEMSYEDVALEAFNETVFDYGVEEVPINPGAAFLAVAVPPPSCLDGGVMLQVEAPREAPLEVPFQRPPPPPGPPGTEQQQQQQVPASSIARSIARSAWERPQSTAEDLESRERFSAETELARETLGRDKKEAREAVRSRLAALRFAKAGRGAGGGEA